tara:strand:+ start:15250 stop:16242 length:993 start_codon:yes stop_codon:yes gene_type:complete
MTTGDFAATQPDNSDTYTSVLGLLRDRNLAVAEGFVDAPTNPQTSFIRWVRANYQWEEYDGAAWQRAPMVLGIAGGGTGAITAAAARTALGLGTIATQAANAVAITGGTISGLTSFTVSGAGTFGSISSAGLIAGNSLSGSGAAITALNGSNVGSGTVPTARLGTGSATSSTYLRGDSTWQAITAVPSDLVAFFTGASCPSGWTEYTGLRGKYVVGLVSGGTDEGGSGTALTNQESRAVGQHTHTQDAHSHGVSDPGHTHNTTIWSGGSGSTWWLTRSSTTGGASSTTVAGALSNTTGLTVSNATATNQNTGSVAGTNAPYVQLIACKKN